MPVALGVNGGVLGSNNLPSSGSAKGIWTPNEIARAVALGFWPVNYARSITETATGADVISTGANADPYFNLTTLLLSTTATNGQQNNTFQDSSTNNFTITRNPATGPNAPTQGTFSPFSQTGWSGSFGNSSSWITTNTTAFSNTASTWTIEAWVYMNALPTADPPPMFGDMQAGGTTNYLSFGPDLNGKLQLYWFDGAAKTAVGNTVMSLNTWNHVAISVNAGAISLFVNGTLQTITGTSTLTNRSGTTGANAISRSYLAFFNAYISNLRVTTTAVYSGSFTPSTTPLTAITGTQLLLFTGNRFVDANTQTTPKTLTITTNSGYPAVVPFSPFNPTSAWSASTVGGSGYFDGTGDYLTAPDNAAFAFGTGDFTIEVWVYWNNVSSTQTLFDFRPNATGSSISPYIELTSSGTLIYYVGGATRITTSAVTATSWTHVALSRSGTSTKIFINGTQSGSTYTDSNSYVQSGATIGLNRNNGGVAFQYMNGYISNFRIVKGTAVYTGNFTPPTAPLTAITNTSLLLNFTNSGIYDATAKNVLETVGNAQASTAITPKWGTTSMYFDGTGDYLLIPDNPSQRIGTGNFTVECWVYRNASGTYGLIGKGTGTTGWLLSLNSSNQVVFTYGSSTITSTGTISATTWTHIAVVRSGTGANLTKIYISGTNDGTGTVSTDFNQTNAMYVAADRTGGSNANAYVQDTRVTLYARYSANFTPPTAAFPVQ